MTGKNIYKHIKLVTHPGPHGPKPLPIHWGAKTPEERGPIIATTTNPAHRNAIGTHSGSYSVYRALAIAAGALKGDHKPDLTNTTPAAPIGPNPQWLDPEKIVSMDPIGHLVSDHYGKMIADGFDIRPTVAVTKARIKFPELLEAMRIGRIKADGKVLLESGDCNVTKVAIEPVWYLPGIAKRFNVTEADLRVSLFENTAGMYPELVTRPDLEVFLPPIGGTSIYLFGDVPSIPNPNVHLACRVHDECNGSDVFGSDICTCRPYLTHGIEICIESAQAGGAGVVIYNRKEGRALGEVTKFLVYNARKRQEGGDRAEKYFERTECVAGVQDVRFQELMPDVLHWLGITRIQRFASMSNMKFDALARAGIQIDERVTIPDDMIPEDAKVEMDAKKAAGYFADGHVPNAAELAKAKGRKLDD